MHDILQGAGRKSEKFIPVPLALTWLASKLFGVYPLACHRRQRAHLSHAVGIQVPQIPPQHPAKGSPSVPPRRSLLRNPPVFAPLDPHQVPEPEPAAMPDHQSLYGRTILAADEQQCLTRQHSNDMSTTNSLDSFSFGTGTEIILQPNHQVIYVPRVTGLTSSAGSIGLSTGLNSSLALTTPQEHSTHCHYVVPCSSFRSLWFHGGRRQCSQFISTIPRASRPPITLDFAGLFQAGSPTSDSTALGVMHMYLLPSNAPPTCYIIFSRSLPALSRRATGRYFALSARVDLQGEKIGPALVGIYFYIV
ncbi:hypothetical protein FB451DRAFT_1190048 [Mycena latifolia]|nr:hypothetical protein FB451DRAFT_1190048 [Mycena latifolia]